MSSDSSVISDSPENGNGNTSNGSPEVSADHTVPLTDLAERLGVSIPRLQRLLKRSEFAPHVQKGQRQTATGMRTVTLVSVSVIEALQDAIRDQNGDSGEQKRERLRSEALVSDDERARALVNMVMQQAEARIGELSTALSDVRGERDRLLEEQKRERLRIEALTLEVAELKAMTEITAKAVEAQEQDAVSHSPVPAGDTEGSDSDPSGMVTPLEALPPGDKEPRRRSFWDRLLGR